MVHYFQRRRDGGQEAGISAHPPAQEHSATASHTKSTDYQVLNLTKYRTYGIEIPVPVRGNKLPLLTSTIISALITALW